MSQIDRKSIRRMVLREMHEMGLEPGMEQGQVFDNNGPEDESGMIRSNLFTVGKKAYELHDMVGSHDDLPEWVQEKIAVIDSMMGSVYDYLVYEYHRFNQPEMPPEPGHMMSDDMIEDGMISEKKDGRVKSKKYHGKEYHATSALIKAIKRGDSYEKLLKLASWADNPDSVVAAAMIVVKGHPANKKNEST